MSLETGKQRFTNAVRCLVDEPGPIKERLLIAYVSQLSAIDPVQDLPGELGSQFGTIQVRLGEDQVQGDRGSAASQLKKMSDETASEIAGEIFSLFLDLHAITVGS